MIPLFKPFMPEIPEINSILLSGALAYGSYTKEFEEKLKDYFGTQNLLVTGTFGDAISVVLKVLDINFEDEVIASPMGCLVSTQPYLSAGLKVQWADIDPMRGTLLPQSVESQITRRTKVIVHNHFCGYPGHIDEINEIGRRYGIPVIDDGIECFGSQYKGKKIGNCGTDITVFSLSAVRFCNCIEGGIIIFQDKNLYEKAVLVRDCGIDRSRFRDDIGEISPNCDISLSGYCATMSNVNGYIGLKQMDYVDELITKHRNQAKQWLDFFSHQSQYVPIQCENCEPNYWVFGFLTENKRETILKFREMGYYTSGVHIRNDIYTAFGEHNLELSGVDKFYESFVAIPCGWWMSK